MIRYILRRALHSIPLLLAVVVLVFVLIHTAPGDPIALLAGDRSTLDYQQRLREQLGLDQPIHVQLGLYLLQILRGDLGFSFTFREPVLSLILGRLPATLLLMSGAFVLSTVGGIWIGLWTGAKSQSLRWNAVNVGVLTLYSIPSFWLGMILLLIFGAQLELFPVIGMESTGQLTGLRRWLDILHHMILPVLTLAAFYLTLIARLTRASVLEALHQDFITTARGKGLKARRVVYNHGLRNALLPVVTFIGLQLGAMVAGFVLVEVVFSWPGLGRLTFEAIIARDFPVISGVFLFISVSVIVGNLIADVLYALIDPRVRYE